MIRYQVPVPGMDENHNKVTCNMTIMMDTDDAVNAQRYYYRMACVTRGIPIKEMSREDLLNEFIAVHWAETY